MIQPNHVLTPIPIPCPRCEAPAGIFAVMETTTTGCLGPHDTNRLTVAVSCENGHRRKGVTYYKCSCGWVCEHAKTERSRC